MKTTEVGIKQNRSNASVTFKRVELTWNPGSVAGKNVLEKIFPLPENLVPIGVRLPKSDYDNMLFGSSFEPPEPTFVQVPGGSQIRVWDLGKLAFDQFRGPNDKHAIRIWLKNNRETAENHKEVTFYVYCIHDTELDGQ